MVIPQDDEFLLPAVVLLLVGEVIGRIGLFLDKIAAVFFVFQNAKEHCAGPFVAVHGADAFLLQFPRDHPCALAFVDELMVLMRLVASLRVVAGPTPNNSLAFNGQTCVL